MALETTCCCFRETSEVPVSKELPPELLPIVCPQGGLGWEQVGSSQLGATWPGLDLPREDQFLPGYPQLVSSALGEFKTKRRSWEGKQAISMLINLLVPGCKQPNLGTRCPTRSLEARATQVTRSR